MLDAIDVAGRALAHFYEFDSIQVVDIHTAPPGGALRRLMRAKIARKGSRPGRMLLRGLEGDARDAGMLLTEAGRFDYDLWVTHPRQQGGRVRYVSPPRDGMLPFGSDLWVEDFIGKRISHWDAALDGEEAVDGHDCIKVALTRRTRPASAYHHMTIWCDAEIGVMRRSLLRAEGIEKRMLFQEYAQIGPHQIPGRLHVFGADGGQTRLDLMGGSHVEDLDDAFFRAHRLRERW